MGRGDAPVAPVGLVAPVVARVAMVTTVVAWAAPVAPVGLGGLVATVVAWVAPVATVVSVVERSVGRTEVVATVVVATVPTRHSPKPSLGRLHVEQGLGYQKSLPWHLIWLRLIWQSQHHYSAC